jgi:hypothetical protein
MPGSGKIPANDRADRLRYTTGASLLITAGLGFYGFFLSAAIHHSNYLALALLLPAVLLAGVYAGRKLRIMRGVRNARIILFLLVTAFSGLFAAAMKVPVNVIAIKAGAAVASTQVLMEVPVHYRRRDRLSEFMARGAAQSSLTFFLHRPIRRRKPPFKITVAGQRHIDIARLSFGSSILFGWLPLAQFQGDDLPQVAGASSYNTVLRQTEQAARFAVTRGSKPRFHIVSDEALVKNHTPRRRVYAIKLIWFLVYTGIAALTIWPGAVARFLSPALGTLVGYLRG